MKQTKRKVLGLAGKARCGKDTVGAYLTETHGFTRDAFADPIKKGLAAMLNISVEALEIRKENDEVFEPLGRTYREMLQTLGTEWGRDLVHGNIWVKLLFDRVEKTPSDIVITDVRFNNEAQMIRDMGGKVVSILRPKEGTAIPESGHVSEEGISKEFIDFSIVNDSSISELLEGFNLSYWKNPNG